MSLRGAVSGDGEGVRIKRRRVMSDSETAAMKETKTGGVPQQKTDIVPSPMMIKTFFINREKARLYPIIFNNFRNLRVGGWTTGGEHADSSHDGTALHGPVRHRMISPVGVR